MAFRREYLEALLLLAEASREVIEQGFAPPVLVGGAAVEYYTGGAIMSGDFDMVCSAEDKLVAALSRRGFLREDREGRLLRGLYHPDLLLGVEIVSGHLFDGRTDVSRLGLVPIDGDHEIYLAPIEDMIADRMGQYSSVPRGIPEMLRQAVLLLRLADEVDEDYLESRLFEETSGEYNLGFLKERSNEGFV